MNIKFIDTKVTRIALDLCSQEDAETRMDDLKFSFTPAFSDLDKSEFLIVFNLIFKNNEFNLDTEYAARFETDEEIDDAFKDSHFVKINAPAISYPFLRAFISNLTINAGFNPVVLPTVNFMKFE